MTKKKTCRPLRIITTLANYNKNPSKHSTKDGRATNLATPFNETWFRVGYI